MSGPPRSEPSTWRAGPSVLVRLLVGLWIFGTGEALVVAARLGNSPWTVFAEGLSVVTPLTVGTATILTGFALLLAWIPLRVRPGLGTIANALVIGVAIDATLALLTPPESLILRAIIAAGGIALVGLGSGLYLSCALGPGPRDGLMTGLVRRTGRPVALVRTGIEVTALVVGVALGGRAGVATVAFALGIGPAVAVALRVVGVPRSRRTPVEGDAA